MKIYRVYQTQHTYYDTYDCIVVCAHDEDDAKTIHPRGDDYIEDEYYPVWATDKAFIECEEIGIANSNQERGVILASFNAG